MGGVPCIRGLRIPVATIVGMVADGMDRKEILAAYPDLDVEDIDEALRYAAEALRERERAPVGSSTESPAPATAGSRRGRSAGAGSASSPRA
jgi:uncharacterized protein (DUF433 family)